MKKTDAFPSLFLKGDDIAGREIPVVVQDVRQETLKDKHGKEELRPVMYFVKANKGLVLNITNWDTLSDELGDDSDNWVGTQVVLFTIKTKNPQGATVNGIRIKFPKAPKATAPKPAEPVNHPGDAQAAADVDADLNDEIPF